MIDTHASEDPTQMIVERAHARFHRHHDVAMASTDRLFGWMLLGQWLFAVLLAIVISPFAWQGKERTVNPHVWMAVGLGALVISLPIWLARTQAGKPWTRHVIAAAQMMLSAILIHLTGGRIETHFHVFGSLAFLAFYLDPWVIVTASVTIALDHFLRGLLWPESVYGLSNPEWWRFLEHGFWVAFCAAFLIVSCKRQIREWLSFAEEGALIEAMAEARVNDRATASPQHKTN